MWFDENSETLLELKMVDCEKVLTCQNTAVSVRLCVWCGKTSCNSCRIVPTQSQNQINHLELLLKLLTSYAVVSYHFSSCSEGIILAITALPTLEFSALNSNTNVYFNVSARLWLNRLKWILGHPFSELDYKPLLTASFSDCNKQPKSTYQVT